MAGALLTHAFIGAGGGGPGGRSGPWVGAVQCSGLPGRKILTVHNFGAFGSGNPDNRTFSRISGPILGAKPLENPGLVRILPQKILPAAQMAVKIMIILEDRDTAFHHDGGTPDSPCFIPGRGMA